MSFPGQLSDEGAIRLDAARDSARRDDDQGQSLCQISVLDHLFESAATGVKLFRYRLSDHAYSIQLKGKGAKHLPLAHVQIRSGHLMAVGVEQAISQLRRILSMFGEVSGPAAVSRLDLCADAVNILRLQEGGNPDFVFHYKGKRITQVGTKAWRAALVRAGIQDFHWHDLRHTWASWHVQHGTPLYALQEMGAWSDVEMVRRYAHLTPGHLAAYADQLAEKLPSLSQQLTTFNEPNSYDLATLAPALMGGSALSH